MSQLLDLTEQLCYVQCSFCDTILLVSVPCSSLLKVVPVRCGHCSNLFSVNMLKASFLPLQLLASINNETKQENFQNAPAKIGDTSFMESFCEEERKPAFTVNKPPEKRHRAPSAYNRFIKEEIQRLKTSEPSISHREALSTAAKNWAHLPRIQHKPDAESGSQRQSNKGKDKHVDREDKEGNQNFQQRKVSQSFFTEIPSQ
uniref:Putative transcription factor n=2 Tax=Nymphaea colorata TaxID=210225 RepID=Q76KB8_9MAGN|nr:putative transcription factor [Nymphaea colorata]